MGAPSTTGKRERKDFQIVIATLEGDEGASAERVLHRSLISVVDRRKSRSLNALPEDVVGWKHTLVKK
jgi:hypothetical protein